MALRRLGDTEAERAAVMYTLIQTAKLNGIDPQAWLGSPDVLSRDRRDAADPARRAPTLELDVPPLARRRLTAALGEGLDIT